MSLPVPAAIRRTADVYSVPEPERFNRYYLDLMEGRRPWFAAIYPPLTEDFAVGLTTKVMFREQLGEAFDDTLTRTEIEYSAEYLHWVPTAAEHESDLMWAGIEAENAARDAAHERGEDW